MPGLGPQWALNAEPNPQIWAFCSSSTQPTYVYKSSPGNTPVVLCTTARVANLALALSVVLLMGKAASSTNTSTANAMWHYLTTGRALLVALALTLAPIQAYHQL